MNFLSILPNFQTKIDKIVNEETKIDKMKLFLSSVKHVTRLLQLQKYAKPNLCTFSTTEETGKSMTTLHEIQKPKIVNNNRLYELLEHKTSIESETARNTFSAYTKSFENAISQNYIEIPTDSVQWMIELGELSEELALQKLIFELPNYSDMIPLIFSVSKIPNHTREFKLTIVKMIDYSLCFKRDLNYQDSLKHSYALFQIWQELFEDLDNEAEITISWEQFAQFPRKTCENILTDAIIMRKMNANEFLISLFFCGLYRKFPISSSDDLENEKDTILPLLIKRKLLTVLNYQHWKLPEMAFFALTLHKIRNNQKYDTAEKVPSLYLFRTFYQTIQGISIVSYPKSKKLKVIEKLNNFF